MDSIPNYATVSTTVELAKSESISFSRVVNAILMNYIRESDSIDFSMINHPKKSSVSGRKIIVQRKLKVCVDGIIQLLKFGLGLTMK